MVHAAYIEQYKLTKQKNRLTVQQIYKIMCTWKKNMNERKLILMCILICWYLQAPLGLAGHFSKYKEASKLTMIDF